MKEKLVITGGNGYLAEVLIKYLPSNTYDIVLLVRDAAYRNDNAKVVLWNGKTRDNWVKELEGAKAIINLAGKSVNCRYNTKNKAAIISSRVDSTKIIGEAIQQCETPPELWFNASSATIYEYEKNIPHTENSVKLGQGFSEDVCRRWEEAANDFNLHSTRKVLGRITLVLGEGGGVLPVLSSLAKKGLGGRQGDGSQMVSWIHEEDFAGMMYYILDEPKISGIVNFSSNNSLSNKEFMSRVREKVGSKFGLNQAEWMVRLGAVFLGTEPELVMKSRYVFTDKMLKSGYEIKRKSFWKI